jgi:hypothetical protein
MVALHAEDILDKAMFIADSAVTMVIIPQIVIIQNRTTCVGTRGTVDHVGVPLANLLVVIEGTGTTTAATGRTKAVAQPESRSVMIVARVRDSPFRK